MSTRPHGAPKFRLPTIEDFTASLGLGLRDFMSVPLVDLFFASFFVISGLFMAWITYLTGQTFWMILLVMGFPLVGTLSALGFYETSRRRQQGADIRFGSIVAHVWDQKGGQLPWLAAIIVVIFMFWFFLGHMIFALFLGLSPMTNVSTSLEVFVEPDGLMMLGFGTVVGGVFAVLIFSVSVLGIPMLLDRDVDFVTAMLRSVSAVQASPMLFLLWGLMIGVITLMSMVPFFLGLFVTMPVLGHATWHLYHRLLVDTET